LENRPNRRRRYAPTYETMVLVTPLALERFLSGVASNFEVVFDLLEPLQLRPELLFAPSFRPILLVLQRINLTLQHLFFRVPLVVKLVERDTPFALERLFIGIR